MKRLTLILVACARARRCRLRRQRRLLDGSTESTASTESTRPPSRSRRRRSEPDGEKTKPKVDRAETAPRRRSSTIEEIEEGDGAEAKAGDEVTVQYVGVGYDSEEEFDSSWSRNEPFTFTLGAGEVIPAGTRASPG